MNKLDRLFDEVSTLPNQQWPSFDLEGLHEEGPVLHDRNLENCELTNIEDFENELDTAERVFDRLTDRSRPPNITPVIGTSEEEKRILAGAIRKQGFEACAFYKSKRNLGTRPFPGYWGIFYLDKAIESIAYDLSLFYQTPRPWTQIARQFLFAHEQYHFFSDIQTLQLEILTGRQLYNPLRRALTKTGSSHWFVEEALANKKAYEWAKSTSVGIEDFAEDFMDVQPGAYNRFHERRISLQGEWYSVVIDQTSPVSRFQRSDLAPWLNLVPRELNSAHRCPEYIIKVDRLSGVIDSHWAPPSIQQIKESKKVEKFLSKQSNKFRENWAQTKELLVLNNLFSSLRFKPWLRHGKDCYSVNVKNEGGFRAHLKQMSHGLFEAYEMGDHKDMGHG